MRTLVAALLLASCLQSNLHPCADGFLCPENLVCAPGQNLCVLPDQLASCNGKAEGAACTFAGVSDAICMAGVCTPAPPPPALCGNGMIDPGEICDGAPPEGQTCLDYAFDAGRLGCSSACVPSLADCRRIGWTAVSFPQGAAPTSMWGSGPNDIYAVAGGLFHYNGAAWSPVNVSLQGGPGAAVWGSGPNDVWVTAAMGAGFMHFDGTKWSPVGSVHAWFVWGSGPSDVYFSGSDLYHWDGNAISVALAGSPNPMGAGFGPIWGSGPSDVYVGFMAGLLHFDGTQWSQVAFGGSGVEALWGSGASDVYAAASDGIYRYDGAAWSRVNAQPTTAIWGSGPGDVFAIQSDSIVHFDGTRWSVSRPSDGTRLNGIWGTGARDIFTSGFLTGTGERVLHYQGSVWLPGGIALPGTIASMWGTAPDDIWAVGNGFVLHYNGLGWTQMTTPGSFEFTAVWASGSNDVYVSGINSDPMRQILHFDGTSWSAVVSMFPAPGGVSGIWGTGPHDVYFLLGMGIARYDGTSWDQTLPPGPCESAMSGRLWGVDSNVFVYNSMGVQLFSAGQCGVPSEFQQLWGKNVSAMWGTSWTDLYFAGPNLLMHYDGTALTSVSVNGADLRAVWGTATNDVFAAGQAGALFHFDGTSWGAVRFEDSMSNIGTVWGAGEGMWFGTDRGLTELVRTAQSSP